MHKPPFYLFIFASLVLSACANRGSVDPADPQPYFEPVANALFAKIKDQKAAYDKDKAAILAMQGEYHVDFDFRETVVLKADYQTYPPKQSDAFETVIVVEDNTDRIVLQHLLVGKNGHVIKHWRQDWHYQAKERFEFVADQTWQVKPIDEKMRKGMWTQCVYEVSDAPRYCGTGKWNHRYGVSTWTSDRTWRPLPRRDYTVRQDYNALNVENRHTITPLGWTHEQDNTKVVRAGHKTEETLVREHGFNRYRRINAYNFKPAYAYWEKTRNFWQAVRNMWLDYFSKTGIVTIQTANDGLPIIMATFTYANQLVDGTAPSMPISPDKLIGEWIATTPVMN